MCVFACVQTCDSPFTRGENARGELKEKSYSHSRNPIAVSPERRAPLHKEGRHSIASILRPWADQKVISNYNCTNHTEMLPSA